MNNGQGQSTIRHPPFLNHGRHNLADASLQLGIVSDGAGDGHFASDHRVNASRNHLAGVIAVVDDEGWPILVLRLDHAAFVASVELAPGKARTAALFKKPSQALEDAINHGRTAAVTAHDFVEMQGGLPVVVDGQVIGGIGASFDTPEHDVEIARAGLVALTR